CHTDLRGTRSVDHKEYSRLAGLRQEREKEQYRRAAQARRDEARRRRQDIVYGGWYASVERIGKVLGALSFLFMVPVEVSLTIENWLVSRSSGKIDEAAFVVVQTHYHGTTTTHVDRAAFNKERARYARRCSSTKWM